MKNYIKSIIVCFSFLLLLSCSDDDSLESVEIAMPSDISAQFTVKQDNSGEVSILPSATGANMFSVDFGDGSEVSDSFAPGTQVDHTYAEGQYDVTIYAMNLNGEVAEASQSLNVSFLAPENLEVTITPTQTNPYEITVSATADNASGYEVYFGETADETPVLLMQGETASYEYSDVGTYTVRVVALSGGAATTEYTEEVVIDGASGAVTFPITFDDATVDYQFVTFNGASFEVVSNPQQSGIHNVETNVGAITNSGNAYEGGSFNLGEALDFSGDNKLITLKFYSEVSVPILLKLEGGVNGERQNEVVVTHGGTGWEELTFDFNTATKSYIDGSQGVGEAFVPTGQYGTVTMFVDGPGETSGTFYIDDLMQTNGAVSGPQAAAPVPSLDAANVISLFSNAYSNVNVNTWRTDWSVAEYEEVSIEGDAVKKYSALDYVGIEATSPMIDASAMTHFHVDVWSSDFTEFRVKLVDFGADAAYGGGDDVEHELAFSAPAQGEWVSMDIALSDFTNLVTKGHIAQLIFSGNPTGQHTVYIDNVYFHN